MPEPLIELITTRMCALNHEIKEDPLLGENYQLGHSYFCPKGDDFARLGRSWYASIVESLVDRETRCFLSIRAVRLRSQEIGQQMVNDAPVAVLQRSVSIVR